MESYNNAALFGGDAFDSYNNAALFGGDAFDSYNNAALFGGDAFDSYNNAALLGGKSMPMGPATFKKGSAEAKAKMAYLRSLRGKKRKAKGAGLKEWKAEQRRKTWESRKKLAEDLKTKYVLEYGKANEIEVKVN